MVILNITAEGFEDKYLGLPVPEGRMKAGKFQSTKDKALKRSSDWIEKYASSGIKENQIKAVLQALPVYAMGIFKFPTSLCDELAQIIRNFWWEDEECKRKIHWLAWDKVTKPKRWGAWASEILGYLIKLSWPNRRGGYWCTQILCVLRF